MFALNFSKNNGLRVYQSIVSSDFLTTQSWFMKRKDLAASFFFNLLLSGGRGTPLYGLYGDVPLDRVWILAPLP